MKRLGLITILALALAISPSIQAATSSVPSVSETTKTENAAFEYCGDVKPIFKNPDLQPRDDGLVYATGWFFIQFQVIVEEDLDVDRLSFSFGKPVPDQARTCETPEWITDAYYKDYRVDDDPSDGFFIPINTSNVPDGEYAAAVSVYSGGEEVGRMFTRAMVENGCTRYGFDCDRDSIQEVDYVKPWPIVLPGDGQQVHGFEGLSIEFAEPVRNVSASLAPAPGQPAEELELTEMEPRSWDEDSVAAPVEDTAPACPEPGCVDAPWGPAYKWEGEIPENSVVTVQAEDMAGNQVTKILHQASTTAGGVISVQQPQLEVKVPDGTKEADAGQTASFPVTFQNVGKDTAHTNLRYNASSDVNVQWEPNHVAVESGNESTAVLKASSDVKGTYQIDAYAVYKQGSQDVRVDIPLTLEVSGGGDVKTANESSTNETVGSTNTSGNTSGENGSPAPGMIALLAVAALSAIAAKRRWNR